MTTTTTHHRVLPNLRQSVFRVYEGHIRRAVLAWPQETVFTSSDMISHGKPIQPTTFAARLRDSILSIRRFSWSTDIDVKKLDGMVGKFVITFGGDGVVKWCHKGTQGRPPSSLSLRAEEEYEQNRVTTASWEKPTPDELDALCHLLDKQRLVGPFRIVPCLTDEEITRLTDNFAVSIINHEQYTTIT